MTDQIEMELWCEESLEGMVLEDDELIDLIDLCGQYAELQKSLSKELERGFFLMAKSRKNGGRVNCESLREDIEANYLVACDVNGEFSSWTKKPKTDPILLVTAMPPPDLRHAQKCFQNSMGIAIDLASQLNIVKKKISGALKSQTE